MYTERALALRQVRKAVLYAKWHHPLGTFWKKIIEKKLWYCKIIDLISNYIINFVTSVKFLYVKKNL